MKKPLSLMLALLLLLLTACGTDGTPDDVGVPSDEIVELSLYTYPVGNWGDESTVKNLLSRFNDFYPHVRVTLTVLENDTAVAHVNAAIESGRAPDVLLATPKCLWDNWGKEDMLCDVSTLCESSSYQNTFASVTDACTAPDGTRFALGAVMMPYCMAINYDLFESVGALQYIDEETHTWSSEDFIHAVDALVKGGYSDAAVVYCGGQNGDVGTRALVNNLFGGRFVNESRTAYDVDSEENIRALQLLADMKGVSFDSNIVGSDENVLFLTQKLPMSLCWSIDEDVKATNTDFTVFPMAFPSDASPALPTEIWGFGLFNNGDAARQEASEQLVRFLTEDDALYRRTVTASTYWPVRPLGDEIYEDTLHASYDLLADYAGAYDQTMSGWATARTEWWNLLQRVGNGYDVTLETETFAKNTAAAIRG